MNPVLLILIVLALIALWFLLAFLFKPLGSLIYKIFKDAMDEINEEDKEK